MGSPFILKKFGHISSGKQSFTAENRLNCFKKNKYEQRI